MLWRAKKIGTGLSQHGIHPKHKECAWKFIYVIYLIISKAKKEQNSKKLKVSKFLPARTTFSQNFWTIDSAFILQMCIPCDKTFTWNHYFVPWTRRLTCFSETFEFSHFFQTYRTYIFRALRLGGCPIGNHCMALKIFFHNLYKYITNSWVMNMWLYSFLWIMYECYL